MILVNRVRIPPIEIGEHFVYLGKQFNFGNSIENIKADLSKKAEMYVTTIDRLPLTTQNRLSIVNQYVYSKFWWDFSIYNLTETWVIQNIDNHIGKYI